MDILLSSFVSQIIDNLDDKDLNKLLKFLENDDDTLYKMNQKVLKIDESGNNKIHKMFIGFKQINGGETGIRTQERVAPLPVFKTGAFNRSAISL